MSSKVTMPIGLSDNIPVEAWIWPWAASILEQAEFSTDPGPVIDDVTCSCFIPEVVQRTTRNAEFSLDEHSRPSCEAFCGFGGSGGFGTTIAILL